MIIRIYDSCKKFSEYIEINEDQYRFLEWMYDNDVLAEDINYLKDVLPTVTKI